MNKFKIGDKVVCINDDFNPGTVRNHKQLPVKNKIYTIRECKYLSDINVYRVLLNELINPIEETISFHGLKMWEEYGFNSDRFKLLDNNSSLEKETNLLFIYN